MMNTMRMRFTLAVGAAWLLAGCAETTRNMEQVDGFYAQARAAYGDSIYLRHLETGRIAECSPTGAGAMRDPVGIAARFEACFWSGLTLDGSVRN